EEEDDLLGGTGANSKYMELKRAYEESLEQKVERLLEPIYGSEMSKVSINVDLDFDSTESTRTTYANPEIRSENVQATGSGEDIERAQTGQVNDNVTNVTGDDNQGSSSFNRIINNELDTEVVTTISAPGTIRRMTSSIVVSANVPTDVQTELEALVASAIGFSEERGDSIAVQGIDFNQGVVAQEEETTKEPSAITNNLNQYLLYFVIFSGVFSTLLIGILLFVLFRKRRKEEEDYLVEEVLEETPLNVTPSPMFESLEPDKEPVVEESIEQQKHRIASEQAMKQKKKDDAAKEYALENPEVAAELIKSWVKDIK
ncbi:flagellar M-ring protein FliF C-terminal domain-containing protein, partial [Jeotgalibaca porci]